MNVSIGIGAEYYTIPFHVMNFGDSSEPNEKSALTTKNKMWTVKVGSGEEKKL